MRPAKPVVPAADDGEDEGPGRTFVKGRYTTTRYQRRSAGLPRLSGEERTSPLPPDDPTIGSPWTRYEAPPTENAPDEEIVVDLRGDTEPEPVGAPPVDRSTWYQRHSAGLPHISEAVEEDEA